MTMRQRRRKHNFSYAAKQSARCETMWRNLQKALEKRTQGSQQ